MAEEDVWNHACVRLRLGLHHDKASLLWYGLGAERSWLFCAGGGRGHGTAPTLLARLVLFRCNISIVPNETQ